MAQVRVICIEKLRRIGFSEAILDMLLDELREYYNHIIIGWDVAKQEAHPTFDNAHGYIVPSQQQISKWRKSGKGRRA